MRSARVVSRVITTRFNFARGTPPGSAPSSTPAALNAARGRDSHTAAAPAVTTKIATAAIARRLLFMCLRSCRLRHAASTRRGRRARLVASLKVDAEEEHEGYKGAQGNEGAEAAGAAEGDQGAGSKTGR